MKYWCMLNHSLTKGEKRGKHSMTNFCLYLVVFEWCLFRVQMMLDSRTGYLIFLCGSNSNFLAM